MVSLSCLVQVCLYLLLKWRLHGIFELSCTGVFVFIVKVKIACIFELSCTGVFVFIVKVKSAWYFWAILYRCVCIYCWSEEYMVSLSCFVQLCLYLLKCRVYRILSWLVQLGWNYICLKMLLKTDCVETSWMKLCQHAWTYEAMYIHNSYSTASVVNVHRAHY